MLASKTTAEHPFRKWKPLVLCCWTQVSERSGRELRSADQVQVMRSRSSDFKFADRRRSIA